MSREAKIIQKLLECRDLQMRLMKIQQELAEELIQKALAQGYDRGHDVLPVKE